MSVKRRLKALEDRQLPDQARETSLAARIVAARTGFEPLVTMEQAQALAERADLLGRIARGWLRIGFLLAEGQGAEVEIDADQALAATMGYLYDKPLQFVLFAFEWGSEPAMCVVELPAAYRQRFPNCQHGPDAWACELLEQIGGEVARRGFDGRNAVEPLRMATASGHGIGKSGLTAWLILFIMSTRPNAKGTVTANTSAQLGSKTWAELGKWLRRCTTAEWFEMTTGKGSSRLAKREAPEAWRCDAQTSREENSESFAGQHAADSTSFYIFDEASAIPEKIWEVAEGGLSDGEPMLFAFGNPTRNTGAFFEAFHGQRHRWATRQIDSRSVAITNKKLIEGWVSDFGADSDFVKVRVRGIFPSASSLQFIGRDLVDEAAERELYTPRGEAVVVGVDVARFGGDASVIWTRIGRDARTFKPLRFNGIDTMTLASHVAAHVNQLRSSGRFVIVNVDGGGIGGAVVDRLRQMGFDVNDVQFGGKSTEPKKYGNKRAEIWGLLKEWLKSGCIPQDEELATDLCSVEYSYNLQDQIMLERKESMKARGLASPDSADALALTFAVPTPAVEEDSGGHRWAVPVKTRPRSINYDPVAALSMGHDPMAGLV